MSILQKLLRAALYGLAPEKKEEHSAALMLRPDATPTRGNDAPLMIRPEPLAPSRQGYAYPLRPERSAPLPLQHYAPPPAPAPVQPRRRRKKIIVTETFISWREK